MEFRAIGGPESSKLMRDYIAGKETIAPFFEYDFQDQKAYQERLVHLSERSFKRDELVQYLLSFNKKYEAPQKVIDNIRRLQADDAVVVIGGQQAGLLTGPAYTIHKCLTIVQFARKQEAELGVPVIPVFWIAGEDHDFDEVNHVYVYDNGTIRKRALRSSKAGQIPVSDLKIDHDKLCQWVEDIFQAFGETAHTEHLLAETLAFARCSQTLVDFFARLIHRWFGKYGLVLLDSGDPALRRLESDYFTLQIENSEAIAAGVVKQLKTLEEKGYSVALDQRPTSANLFYLGQSERILLDRGDNDTFNGRDLSLTKASLLQTAACHPERLSNNVVTRPLMQELLFPTLAFIAGPGEIAYWSALKQAFRAMGTVMPPVVPRIRLTLMDNRTKRWVDGKRLSLEQTLGEGLEAAKNMWLDAQHNWDVQTVYETVKQKIDQAYEPLKQLAEGIDDSLGRLSLKNKQFIEKQLCYMHKAIERRIREKYETELKKFDRIQAALSPDGQPQERIWNIYYFINYWGSDFIDALIALEFPFDGHPVIVEI
ncbi:bacillithiol biosynthesis cysteine-adding enzyme BshC [Camelliibacillus cellulosilyticus]|uniref:Putative cysteine ligase BshC n=1 Tax=Camelliibacillus cellulosilyticus TaxID=2174486 RepID=A0ABV9GJI4_9BACL